jgi:hypothetical protein
MLRTIYVAVHSASQPHVNHPELAKRYPGGSFKHKIEEGLQYTCKVDKRILLA